VQLVSLATARVATPTINCLTRLPDCHAHTLGSIVFIIHYSLRYGKFIKKRLKS
jgi:hypothetical protein